MTGLATSTRDRRRHGRRGRRRRGQPGHADARRAAARAVGAGAARHPAGHGRRRDRRRRPRQEPPHQGQLRQPRAVDRPGHRRRRGPHADAGRPRRRAVLGHRRRHGPDRRDRAATRPAAPHRVGVLRRRHRPHRATSTSCWPCSPTAPTTATATRRPGSTPPPPARSSAGRCSPAARSPRVDQLPREAAQRPAEVRRPAAADRSPTSSRTGWPTGSTLRAFSELWYRKAPRRQRGAIQNITAFYQVLDLFGDWNRVLRLARVPAVPVRGAVRRGADAAPDRREDRRVAGTRPG